MKNKWNGLIIISLTLLFIFCSGIAAAPNRISTTSRSNQDGIFKTIIIISDRPLNENHELLDREQIQAIFRGQFVRWANRDKITVILYPRSHPMSRLLAYDFLGITLHSYYSNVYSNVSHKHMTVKYARSEEEMFRLVKTTRNSIGFISNGGLIINQTDMKFVRLYN